MDSLGLFRIAGRGQVTRTLALEVTVSDEIGKTTLVGALFQVAR